MILASNSPRRIEILQKIKLPFLQMSSGFDEESVQFDGSVEQYTQAIAHGKCRNIARLYPDELVISADTTVFFDHRIFNKPRDCNEAKKFYQILCGQTHLVVTSLCASQKGITHDISVTTQVSLRMLSEAQIEALLHRFDYLDKAGGYAIQEAGSLLVEKIEGCYDNVLGLPLHALEKLLACFGVNLWAFV